MRPVDYDLVDRLERARFQAEKAYVCTFWDWLKDFRDRFTEQGWWVTTREIELARIKVDPCRGLVVTGDLWLTCDEAVGEIG